MAGLPRPAIRRQWYPNHNQTIERGKLCLHQGVNDVFRGGSLSLTGSGFMDGMTTIYFGSQFLEDPSSSNSVFDNFGSGANVTIPNGVPFGPISVSTLGGTSEAFGLTFDQVLNGVATSGTPADIAQASANPGQVLDLEGSGFDPTTDVVFRTIDQSGNGRETVVRPTAVTPDGTRMSIVVPADAVTGTVSIVGDQNNTEFPLQIVPVLSSIDLTSLSSGTFSATLSSSFAL